jgi:hypothetical protein
MHSLLVLMIGQLHDVMSSRNIENKKVQSNQYIKATQGNLKMWPSQQLPFIYRLKLYALIINGENETALYIRHFFHQLNCA